MSELAVAALELREIHPMSEYRIGEYVYVRYWSHAWALGVVSALRSAAFLEDGRVELDCESVAVVPLVSPSPHRRGGLSSVTVREAFVLRKART